ncbi:unnamed protein product [marine sediment metagenome]|uniref:Uncharacterized protein n=1 Tax=marine sediment metagenome TaxID=412755 RepID=X1NSW7_9ZZZZ
METKEKNRKNYKKPQINQVNLVIEEAVLAACKTGPAAAGAGAQNCDHSGCKKSVYGS